MMAVLPGIPGLSACVRVAGQVATEYDAPDDDQAILNINDRDASLPRAHCYIESKTGVEFSVDVNVNTDFFTTPPALDDSVATHLYIDGTWMDGKAQRRESIMNFTTLVHSATRGRSETDGRPVSRRFVFAAITKSDTATSESLISDVERAKSLGTIKVVIETCKHAGIFDWDPSTALPGTPNLNCAEKAMKGRELSHGTSLVTGTERPSRSVVRTTDRSKIGVFYFYYRSHEALQHEMIIPRSPSPGSSPLVDAPLSRLPEGEIRRLARERLRDIELKQDAPRRVKRERAVTPTTPRFLKVIKLADGREAFDLTDDD